MLCDSAARRGADLSWQSSPQLVRVTNVQHRSSTTHNNRADSDARSKCTSLHTPKSIAIAPTDGEELHMHSAKHLVECS